MRPAGRVVETPALVCVVISNSSYPTVKNNNTAYHAFGKYWMQARGFSFKTAVPKLFGCWAKFAILSTSVDRTILCIENKKKYNTHNTSHVCIFLFIFFARYMFAMWFMTLLRLLHNSCRLIFGSMLDAAIRRVSCKYSSEILFTTAR